MPNPYLTARIACALTVVACLHAAPGFAQPPEPPRVSIAVPPPDVSGPPADAETTASGLASKVLVRGAGTQRPGAMDVVTIHYTGWTFDGHLIDSSVLRGRPNVSAVQKIIKGWSEGLQLMVEGEKRRLWIPAGLAYEGIAGRPQGMVVFDVELLDILTAPTTPFDLAAPPADAERTTSGLASRILEPGTGRRRPERTSTVTVHFSGWTADGSLFDSSVSRGEAATLRLDEVIPGWTEGVQLMVEGEKRRFWVPEALAFGGSQSGPKGVMVFDLHLIAIDP